MLGDGGGNQPPEDQITEAMVLFPGEAILYFGRCFRNEGLPYCRARNIDFSLRPIQLGWETHTERSFEENCAGRTPHHH